MSALVPHGAVYVNAGEHAIHHDVTQQQGSSKTGSWHICTKDDCSRGCIVYRVMHHIVLSYIAGAVYTSMVNGRGRGTILMRWRCSMGGGELLLLAVKSELQFTCVTSRWATHVMWCERGWPQSLLAFVEAVQPLSSQIATCNQQQKRNSAELNNLYRSNWRISTEGLPKYPLTDLYDWYRYSLIPSFFLFFSQQIFK